MKRSILTLIICLFPISSLLFSQTNTTPQVVTFKPSMSDYQYYKKFGKTNKAWDEYVKLGFETYDKGDCDKAIAYFKEAIKSGSNDPLLIFKLAACSELTGSNISAEQYYQQIESSLKILKSPHPYQNLFYEAYGRTLVANQKVSEALPYLKQATEKGPPSFNLFFLVAQIYLSQNNTDQAIEFYKKAINQDLNGVQAKYLAKAYGMLARSYYVQKNYEEVIKYADLSLKLEPNDNELKQIRLNAGEQKRSEHYMKMFERK